MTPRIRVTRPMLYRLAAEAGRDPKTVEEVLAGRGSDQSRAAVLGAATRLLAPTDPLLAALSVDPTPTRMRAT
jgi:hypothetical protein